MFDLKWLHEFCHKEVNPFHRPVFGILFKIKIPQTTTLNDMRFLKRRLGCDDCWESCRRFHVLPFFLLWALYEIMLPFTCSFLLIGTLPGSACRFFKLHSALSDHLKVKAAKSWKLQAALFQNIKKSSEKKLKHNKNILGHSLHLTLTIQLPLSVTENLENKNP